MPRLKILYTTNILVGEKIAMLTANDHSGQTATLLTFGILFAIL